MRNYDEDAEQLRIELAYREEQRHIEEEEMIWAQREYEEREQQGLYEAWCYEQEQEEIQRMVEEDNSYSKPIM